MNPSIWDRIKDLIARALPRAGAGLQERHVGPYTYFDVAPPEDDEEGLHKYPILINPPEYALGMDEDGVIGWFSTRSCDEP